ncbi:hypothetical protein [Trichlorobacter ammonificans]|uniref:Uncharacterized protein n=1 Tax=Trichlorobacter ammonificans TaxID=2916410 RepID=A0ABM9D7Y1_9BACT|nr:hypothetical protein [Trichlorobacter ammonificans]CAH2031323.1 conserved exported protein of unknown function [Trichlorobacter ammonificans]
MRKKLICTILAMYFSTCPAHAAEKVVSCEVYSNNQPAYTGTCLFIPEAGGSFVLSHTVKGKPLVGEVTDISVTIVEKGVAEVRGLTKRGNNSRWGEAKRSQNNKACWEGADFKVCAR